MTNSKNKTNWLLAFVIVIACILPMAIGKEFGLLGSVVGCVASFATVCVFAWRGPTNPSQDAGMIVSMTVIAIGFSEVLLIGPDESWIRWFAKWGIVMLVLCIGSATLARIPRPKRPDSQSAEASNS